MTNTQQKYHWVGMNKQGARVQGVIEAIDNKAAEAELKNQAIEVISLEAKRPLMQNFFRKKVKTKEIIFFTRYLTTMISAGMPILHSLDVIAQDQENPTMKAVVVSIRTNITSGMTLSDSLSQFPDYFDDLYCNLTKAGERSATLENVLGRIAKYMEKTARIKRKVKNALIYPAIISSVALGVSLILLLFVVPQFQKMFQDAHVPLPYFTQLIIHLSDFIKHFWWLLIAITIFMVWGFKYLRKNNVSFDEGIDRLSLRIFLYGPIIKKAIIARFTRTLSITLDAGLPIVEAMKIMVNIMNNRIYSNGISKVCEDLTTGNQLSVSMEKTKLFPNMVIQMVSVGEASGAMGEMLNSIASYYEEEVDSITDNLSSLVEPVVIVVLGAIIGCFVVAMYLPIFKLGSTI